MVEYNNNDGGFSIFVFFLLFLFLILLIGGSCTGGYYYYQKYNSSPYQNCSCCENSKIDHFADVRPNNNPESDYNALYTNKYVYTQPMGDTKAQAHGNSGQGTKGEFLPLQGKGAPIHMMRSTKENRVIKGPFDGVLGGQSNLEMKKMTPRWLGFNSFPYQDENSQWQSDSYLITGANERVCNPGQKCENLPCPDWWPHLTKKDGYCVQDSDLLVNCKGENRNINTCDSKKFVEAKNESQWRKVMNNM